MLVGERARSLLALPVLLLASCTASGSRYPPPLNPQADLTSLVYVAPPAKFAALWDVCRDGKANLSLDRTGAFTCYHPAFIVSDVPPAPLDLAVER
jgi:hypothetical protein